MVHTPLKYTICFGCVILIVVHCCSSMVQQQLPLIMKLIVVVVVVRVVIVDTTGIMVDNDDIVRTIPEFVRTNPTKPAHGGKKQKNDEVAHEGGCG